VFVMVMVVYPGSESLAESCYEGHRDLPKTLFTSSGECNIQDDNPAGEIGRFGKSTGRAESKFGNVKHWRRHPSNCWTTQPFCPHVLSRH